MLTMPRLASDSFLPTGGMHYGQNNEVFSLSSPSQSASPEQASVQSLAQQLRRVVLQNRRLLENWEAERAHLEANRARAEEVYKEEREIMDEERVMWGEEKARLEKELLEWKRRAELAETERDAALVEAGALRRTAEALRHQRDHYHRLTVQGGTTSGSSGATPAATGSGSSGSPGDRTALVAFKLPTDGVSPLTGQPFPGLELGATMPESKPFVPLDPRMQSASSTLASPDTERQPVPSVNISEVIPGLEGIRVKKPALEKPTFTDDKPSPAPTGSEKPTPSASNNDTPDVKPRPTSAEIAKQVLKAPEDLRLTMHAGHTPNHSISLSRLHTAQSTQALNTANSSGASSPKREQSEPGLTDAQEGQGEASAAAVPGVTGDDDASLGQMDPSDGDRPMKGPLQLRNRPASDEVFLQKVFDKLEDSIKSNDVTPTVLRSTAPTSPAPQSPPQHAPDDAGVGAEADKGEEGSADADDIEADVTLRNWSFAISQFLGGYPNQRRGLRRHPYKRDPGQSPPKRGPPNRRPLAEKYLDRSPPNMLGSGTQQPVGNPRDTR
ncbi:hypothetical protein DL766_008789 [Monosporascus sp. MC13-8B]|uniref:GDP/GTP exchange factor Sec2 N-terminal domain-containing protein n=1 Tax=Monosporascus cannonballus TaxID=155416 RepID=A0ABY0GZ57_9PEZI|nr:hypothetical protein DL762_007431 [Monosporascus cannonballus]RYP17939.1 hypothetical protein DL766_008789 [Monosporascus sp. MC13-8B]